MYKRLVDWLTARSKQIIWSVLKTRFFNDIRPNLCQIEAFLIEGKNKGTNSCLSALIFGREEFLHYFSRLVFSEEPTVHTLEKKTYSDIRSVIKATKPDIVLVETDKIFSEFLSKDFLILPIINFSLDISASWDAIYARLTHKRETRRRIRKIEKLGYTYEITNEPEKLDLFYHEMYKPHILKRYGKSARLVSFADSKKIFRKGGLLFVKQNDKYISGVLYGIKDSATYAPLVGIYEGKNGYLAKGAGDAYIYYMIHWSSKLGCKKFDFGNCFPFMRDGLFLYKRSWDMGVKPSFQSNIPVLKDERILALRFRHFGKTVREFLLNNPFVFIDPEDLKGLVILNSKSEDLYRAYHVPGLSGLIVLCQSSNTPGKLQRLSSEDDSVQISPPLSFLMKMTSKEGFDVYYLDFYSCKQKET